MVERKTKSKSTSKGNKRKASDASIDNNPPSKKNKNDEQQQQPEDNSLPTCSEQPKNDTKQCCEWPVTTFHFQAEHGYNQRNDPLMDTEDTGKIASLQHLLSLFEENYMPIITKNSLINKNVVVSQSNFIQKDKLYSTPLYGNVLDEMVTVTMIGRQKIRLLAPETTKAAYLCTYDLDENRKLSESPNGGIRFKNWTLYPTTKSSPVKKSTNTLFATENDKFHHKKGPTIQRRLFWVTINKINKEEGESPTVISIHCLDDTIDNFEDITRNNRTVLYRKKLWTEVENLPTKMITDGKTTLLDLRQTGMERTGLPILIPENDTIGSSEELMKISMVGSINNIESHAVMPTKMITDSNSTLLDLTQTGMEQDALPFNPMQLQQPKCVANELNILIRNEESVKTSMVNSIINIGAQTVTTTDEGIEYDDMDVDESFLPYEELYTQSAATITNQPVPNNVDEIIGETLDSQLTDFNDDDLDDLLSESLEKRIENTVYMSNIPPALYW